MPNAEPRIDDIEVIESTGHIQVRTLLPNGEFHRHVLAPGDSLTGQNPEVVAAAQAIWTPEVVEQYQATANSIPNNPANEE